VAVLAEMAARRVDLGKIWDLQDVTPAVKELVVDWMPKVQNMLVESVGTRNPTEWFKQEDCWKTLRTKAQGWTIPDAVKAELGSVSGAPQSGTHEEENNIARCLEISAETWFKIQIWGAESGKLASWQTGIANTLAGYAAAGWRRKPSVKQANQAVKILETARESPESGVK
jgi:hypothetical protein